MKLSKLFIIFFILTVVATNAQQLYINEVLSTGSPDWIEIYNPNNVDVNLGGWLTWDGSVVATPHVLPDTAIVPAHGFIVLLCDDLSNGLHTNYKLSSGGETVWIANPSGVIVDSVTFPALTSGTSYGRNPDGSPVFEIFTSPTQGTSNGTTNNLAPVISDYYRTPFYPVSTDEVTVTVKVTDDSGIEPMVTLYYNNGLGYLPLTMQATGIDNIFTVNIPAQPAGVYVEMYFVAKDNMNLLSYLPDNAPTSYYLYQVLSSPYVAPKVYINEIMASNATTIQDPDFASYSDYIEIYNDEDVPVDLTYWYITDNLTNPWKYQLTNPTKLMQKSYLLIWADSEDTVATAYHTNFGLSKNGEAVGLYNPDGYMIDTVHFPALTDDVTYSRFGDGNPFWLLITPTAGTTNVWSSVEDLGVVATSFNLMQNYPNPFNPSTKIRFSIPANSASKTILRVYDALGSLITTLVNENMPSGTYEVDFNGSNLASGVYFYSLENGNNKINHKMILAK